MNPSRRLTPEQVLEIRSSTLTNTALAEQFGISRSAIQRVRVGTYYKDYPWPDVPVAKNTTRKLTPRQVLNIRSSSLGNKTLAKKYKLASSVINNIRSGFTYKECAWPKEPPQRHVQGVAYNRSLTEDQVRQIRIDAATERYKDIAARLNVCPSTISNVMRGKVYNNVV